jgi:hypothetical protein
MDSLYSLQNNNKLNAALTGVFFIVAAISSIAGLKLYDPILASEDFLITGSSHYNQVISGAICELILSVSAVGTGIMLYPYMKRYNESSAIGYLGFRLLEVVFIVIGIICILTTLSISQSYNSGIITDKMYAQSFGKAFIAAHDWTFIIGPNFMLAVNTFIYSYVFFKTELVPKKLAALGITASFLIMIAAICEMFGLFKQISFWGILLALPIAAYEIILAIRLISKGFKTVDPK